MGMALAGGVGAPRVTSFAPRQRSTTEEVEESAMFGLVKRSGKEGSSCSARRFHRILWYFKQLFVRRGIRTTRAASKYMRYFLFSNLLANNCASVTRATSQTPIHRQTRIGQGTKLSRSHKSKFIFGVHELDTESTKNVPPITITQRKHVIHFSMSLSDCPPFHCWCKHVPR